MERKAKRAWLVLKGHVDRKAMREKMAQTVITETGNSVRGRVQTTLTLAFSRIAFSPRRRTIPLSVLFFKATFIWEAVAAAASDGSSPLMAPSAVVLCLSMWSYGSEIKTKITTDREQ